MIPGGLFQLATAADEEIWDLIGIFETRSSRPCNNFFDSISLLYLFKDGERHELLPGADGLSNMKVTNDQTDTSTLDVGVSGSALSPTPEVKAQVGREMKLTYESDDVKSWRTGLSLESRESLHKP